MDNKKLGAILLVIALGFAAVSWNIYEQHKRDMANSCGCAQASCPASNFGIMNYFHVAMVLTALTFSLGTYLLVFEKDTAKELLNKFRADSRLKSEEEKLNILFMGLNPDERKIIEEIRKQDGLTQRTLRLRTDLHKSKLSLLLSSLERKSLIKRVDDGKTKRVFIKFKF